jgi:hypothetical protein
MKRIQGKYFLDGWLAPEIEGSPYYMECLESMHPKIRKYSEDQKSKAYNGMAFAHPRLSAEIAKKRNELYTIPNYPTSNRLMEPDEQKFLSQAMQLFKEGVDKKPLLMHGEWGAIGDRQGEVVHLDHNPAESITMFPRTGDAYALHSHPPFGQPFDFSASEQDHRIAAQSYLYRENKAKEYLTNGKDVLLIQPDSLELILLHPDPDLEKTLGEFPVAFTLPVPRQPPYPHQNHEAPATFKGGWMPPAGWKPPEDYPRD